MQEIVLPNHTAYLVETNDGKYFLGFTNEEINTLEIIMEEQYQIDNLNALTDLSNKINSFFLIPILPSIAFEMLENGDKIMYREVFNRLFKNLKHSETILNKFNKRIEKPYKVSTTIPPFLEYINEQFKVFEQIQKINEDKINREEALNKIPKASEELLAYKQEKERLLALRGQLLNKQFLQYSEEINHGESKGKQKTLSTKAGKVYSGLEPDGFINIFFLCIITLYVTVGTMLAVIFTLR